MLDRMEQDHIRVHHSAQESTAFFISKIFFQTFVLVLLMSMCMWHLCASPQNPELELQATVGYKPPDTGTGN